MTRRQWPGCIVERCDGGVQEEEEGGVGGLRGVSAVVAKNREAMAGRRRDAPAQAPPGKWRHKRPHGRNHPPAAVVRAYETEMEPQAKRRRRGRRGGRDGGVRRGRVGGCKCPRDVSDRCAASRHPPPLLRDLKTFSEPAGDELRLSFSFRRIYTFLLPLPWRFLLREIFLSGI